MAGGTVGWHFFDVESGLVPDESSPSILPGQGRGRIVVLAATPFAMEEGWAARAAALVADRWAREGLRIFLMDLGLEDPSIHEVLDLPNEEGVSDAFLFGASIQHIARPAMDESFFFAPAGSRPGNPAEVLGHPRWNDLAGGFSEADATLLLFLPVEISGADRILSRATDIVFFSAQGESPETHLGPASIKIVANIGPVGSPAEELPLESEGELEKVFDGGFPDLGEDLLAPGFAGEGTSEAEEKETLEEERTGDLQGGLSFDFTGDFELAEGFGEEPEMSEVQEEPGEEAVSGLDEGPETVAEDAGALPDFTSGADISSGEEFEPGDLEGFGDDLTMGSSLAETEEEARSTAPDFEAEFVEFSAEDEEPESQGEFGSDLVQGADFGGPASEEPGGSQESAPGGFAAQGVPPEEEVEEPGPHPPRDPPKRRAPPKKPFPFGRVAAIVVLLGVIGAAAGAALGYIQVPGLGFLKDYFGDIPDPPLTLAGPEANEDVLRFSLVLFAYESDDLADANEMLTALRSRLPQLLFFLTPQEDDGQERYVLMAGPAYDRIQAEELRSPISEVLTREDSNSWAVRETPRAFYIGERQTLPEAEEYLNSLSMERVYPYILHVTYSDGTEAFEILAGAYEGVQDARPLQRILWDSGLRDLPLIERRGSLPE